MATDEHEQSSIPVIDISVKSSDAANQLLSAASRYGFVFIENDETIIPSRAISEMFDLSQRFFAAPFEVKEKVAIHSNSAGKNHGWLSRGVEKLDPLTQKRPDVKEAFNIGSPLHGSLQQPLPEPLQPYEEMIVNFQHACRALCSQVLKQFATALEIDEDWFTSRHDEGEGRPSGTVFRLLYYPQIDSPEDGVDIRAGAHSDYGSITLLFQQLGQPGLEVRMPSGEWAAVSATPYPNGGSRPLPILLNIGDLLEDWTGNLLKSTVHRVIFPKGGGGDRYSMAYFCHPLDDARLEPVPSRLVEEHAKSKGVNERNGRVITARDHLMERLAATYKVK